MSGGLTPRGDRSERRVEILSCICYDKQKHLTFRKVTPAQRGLDAFVNVEIEGGKEECS